MPDSLRWAFEYDTAVMALWLDTRVKRREMRRVGRCILLVEWETGGVEVCILD